MELTPKTFCEVIVLASLLFVQGCENNNAFSWAGKPVTGSSSEATLAGADRALRDKRYEEAIKLYGKVLAADADNSKALYGKAAAEIKEAGLDLAHLISAITGETDSEEDPDLLDLIIGGLDMGELSARSGAAAGALKIIADGRGDGVIPADDADVNINLAAVISVNTAAGLLVKYGVKSLSDLEDISVSNSDIDDTVARLEDAKKYAVVALGAGSDMIEIFDEMIKSIEDLKNP